MKARVALVYDRVNTPYGGAEKVLLALHQAFPQAPLLTSVYQPTRASWAKVFSVQPSFLQHLPAAANYHRFYAPLMPLAFESFNLDQYQVVISITSAEAKGILTQPHQLHLSYLLTPTRYLYSHHQQYQQSQWPLKLPLVSHLTRPLFTYLQWWDQVAAHRPDFIIPISQLVKKRVERYYHRSTLDVIYPPFENSPPPTLKGKTNLFDHLPPQYLLVISRLVPYKKIDLVIAAANQLQRPLVIGGTGPALSRLKKLAGPTVYFLGNVTDDQRQILLSRAQAVIMPGIEDFGITALEAASAEVPVIVHAQSGAAELLPTPQVSLHLSSLDLTSLITTINQLDQTKFKFHHWRQKMKKYAINSFVDRFRHTVETLWHQHQKGPHECS